MTTISNRHKTISHSILALFICLAVFSSVDAATPDLSKALSWRHIGPYRGGRVVAVAGVPSQPEVYYMGAVAGGVWKTEDSGLTWHPLSDGFFNTAAVGAIAVSESDPNVIYAGTGEACIRNNISHGDGVYKSTDGGATWSHVGLFDSRYIARIRIHPTNPDLVYVAALGHVAGENEERGIFRSSDGGQNWERVLFVDSKTGASDLILDPSNPRILYAGMWQILHRPWGIFSGGPGSGLYKSTDGGDTWKELTGGLPAEEKGRVGVAVSPVNPQRVWALIEAEKKGGVYRSDDGGKHWRLLNDGIQVRRRAEYYTHIFADTQEENTVYVLTSPFLKSTDGGETFHSVRVPHGDTHDLWISPHDNQRMINGNDGGACVSINGGESWSTLDNQPTAQFYMVNTDDQFPYRIYGAQQDNTTVSIPSRTLSFGITENDWYPVGGGESGYIAPHPEDPNLVFAGTFWGVMTRYNHITGQSANIQIWPEIPSGRVAAEWEYRFDWTYPILISPHDPSTLYAGANVVFRSRDQGQSWEAISPDLTRNDKEKQAHARLTEIYDTILALRESPLQQGVLWSGADDGMVYLSRDGGQNWNDVTPPQMPEWSRVNIIEVSPHQDGTAYLAVNRRKMDDYTPYLYKTTDFGANWQLITSGIRENDFVRTIREDPEVADLLYAGTETGVYYSRDGGRNWQSLQLNLPAVPVADLAVKEGNLVAATHGRSFWILDDLDLLRQLDEPVMESPVHLFEPAPAYRLGFAFRRSSAPRGENPPRGLPVFFHLQSPPEGEIRLEFLESDGTIIRSFTTERPTDQFTASQGLNRFVWDLRYPDAEKISSGTFLFGGNLSGPEAVPGNYRVRLSAAGQTVEQPFEILKDPRVDTTPEQFSRQFDLLIQIRDSLSSAHRAVNQIQKLQPQLEQARNRARLMNQESELVEAIARVESRLNQVLNQIVELRFRGIDDQMLLYPVQLNVKTAYLQRVVASGDREPTEQAVRVFEKLNGQLQRQLQELKQIVESEIPSLNRMAQEKGLPAVQPVER